MNPQLTQDFHKQFYKSIDWRKDLTYRGVPILKNPLDLFIEQQIIWASQPDVIIETGTAHGGSALYYADLLEKIGKKNLIVTIDIEDSNYSINHQVYEHPRILTLNSGSLSGTTIDRVQAWVSNAVSVMVILDSDHHMDHVYAELKTYAPFVTSKNYLIVEDTNTDLVLNDFGPGAKDAINEFLKMSIDFLDWTEECSPFGFSFNTWLKKL